MAALQQRHPRSRMETRRHQDLAQRRHRWSRQRREIPHGAELEETRLHTCNTTFHTAARTQCRGHQPVHVYQKTAQMEALLQIVLLLKLIVVQAEEV